MTQRKTDSAYTVGSWSLDDIVPADSALEMERAFEDIEAAVAALEAKCSELVPTIAETTFVEVLGLIEELERVTARLDGYSILRHFADMKDQDAIALRGCVDKTLAEVENRTLFFDLWWKALDETNAQRLLAASGDNVYYLEQLRSFAPYTLSEAEERVINSKNVNGTSGLVTLYEMITSNFTFDIEIDGESQTLTCSGLMDFVRDASPELREAAYRSLLGVYESHSDELAQIYKCIAADWHSENVELRGIPSAISVRNVDNGVSDDVVEAMLESCRENVDLFQRYFRLKAKWLGLEKLRRFDLRAPLEEAADEIPFAVGVKLILKSFSDFSPKLAELAERVLVEGHLDSVPRPGKRGGGVSWDALPGMTPWALVSYHERVDDVTTLAHELGHTVHALMAANHSVLTFSPPLPLAETASSFGQILLLETMLEGADAKLRRTLLSKYIEDSCNQILSRAFVGLFEQEAHRMISEGGATPDQLSDAYLMSLREQFGESVEVDDVFRYEWFGMRQLYAMPFYSYAYAFGLLLVLSLYQCYKEEGDAFVPSYLAILAYGGSKAPADILSEVGFDIRSKEFWQGGFDILSDMVDELESLS